GYFGGTTQAESLEWFAGTPMYDSARANYYTFDLDKARSLLKQANVGNFNMDLVFIPSPESASLAQIYQADLASIGITLNIVNRARGSCCDLLNTRRYHGMYYSPAGISSSVGTELTTSKIWEIGNNNSGFDSQMYQTLGAASTTETDPDKLKQIY